MPWSTHLRVAHSSKRHNTSSPSHCTVSVIFLYLTLWYKQQKLSMLYKPYNNNNKDWPSFAVYFFDTLQCIKVFIVSHSQRTSWEQTCIKLLISLRSVCVCVCVRQCVGVCERERERLSRENSFFLLVFSLFFFLSSLYIQWTHRLTNLSYRLYMRMQFTEGDPRLTGTQQYVFTSRRQTGPRPVQTAVLRWKCRQTRR